MVIFLSALGESLSWQCFCYKYTIASWKYTHPPFSQKVIAKGHLLLEKTPNQQSKTIHSRMHIIIVMKSVVYMYVWASSWSGRNWAEFSLTTQDWCSPETLPHKMHQNRGLHQTHVAPPRFDFCTMKSCSHRWTKGCHGSGHDRGASSKWMKRASYL